MIGKRRVRGGGCGCRDGMRLGEERRGCRQLVMVMETVTVRQSLENDGKGSEVLCCMIGT